MKEQRANSEELEAAVQVVGQKSLEMAAAVKELAAAAAPGRAEEQSE
jgi:hypothetical protein